MKKKATPKLSSNVTSEQQSNELQDAIKQYHEWCVEWRRLNDSLEEELQRTQFMLMDAQAVIVYLENKLGVGI
jgi:uncharacterized coiled-coil DUF342 family protein